MTDFSAILEAPLDSFEKPKPIPTGGYIWTLGQFKLGETTGEKKTPFVEYPLIAQEALGDVDNDALMEYLNGSNLVGKENKITFYLTPNAAYRLKEFLRDHVGVPEGLPTQEALQQAVGRNIVGVVTHTPNRKTPGEFYANIDATAAVPE